jgi:hypothetical protein
MTIGDGESPEATIDDMAWIQGYWTGKFMGGNFEEIWSPPANGSMMGSFKQMNEDTVNFYEILVIKEVGNSLVLKLKHFHNDLRGWEAQDEVINWPLVKMDENRAYFDGLTFEKIDEDHLKVYLAVSFKEGEVKEFTLYYNRGAL